MNSEQRGGDVSGHIKDYLGRTLQALSPEEAAALEKTHNVNWYPWLSINILCSEMEMIQNEDFKKILPKLAPKTDRNYQKKYEVNV